MARTFGKLLCTIWTDDDFIALTPEAKVLFAAFISQSDITAAGILPLTERRWKRWIDGTQEAVNKALDELAQAGFVMLDEDTAEVWIKSFIRYDGRLENSKLARSVHSAIVDIRSPAIAETLSCVYPGITPRRRAFDRPSDGPSDKTGTPIEPPCDVTDLYQYQEPRTPPLPSPAQPALTVQAIANEAGRIYAEAEMNSGRGRNLGALKQHKTDQLLDESPKRLEGLVGRAHRYAASGAGHIPITVLAAAALGDGHSLAMYPEPTEPEPEPGPKLSPDAVKALIETAKATTEEP